MKLGFTTLGCPEWKIEEIAPKARSMGYEGVEIRVAGDGLHLKHTASADELRRVKAMFDEAGMPIFALCGYPSFAAAIDKEVQMNNDMARALIAMARALGAKAIRCYGGKFENEDVQTVAARAAKMLRPLAKEAADNGVCIALETHTCWARGSDMMRIIEQVDSPGVGVLFDVNNTFVETGEWIESYRVVRQRICYCHLKDDYALNGKRMHVPPGAGDLPLADVLAQLKRDNYAGYLSFEWERRWEPELAPADQALPQYVHKIRKVWDSL
jgi:sugar phosphate isomerase/epimerase